MADKKIPNSRIILKHDTTENWGKATTFIPLAGELILYTDTNKQKIGDGTTLLANLPYIESLPTQSGQSGKFLTTNGTNASWATVDMSAKADKVTNATNGNFAGLDANGNLTDSGKKSADFATAAQGALADTAIQNPGTKSADQFLKYDGSAWVAGTITKVTVGLDNVDNTSDATKKTNFTGSIASGDTGFVTGDAVYQAIYGAMSAEY